MPDLSETYFSRIRDIIQSLRPLIADLPPEHAAPILAYLEQMEAILANQKSPLQNNP